MPPRRPLPLAAVVLLAAAGLLTLALARPRALGDAGTATAAGLVAALGLAAWVLAVGWWVVGLQLLLRRRPLWVWWARVAGWSLLVACAAFAADALPVRGVTPFGAGGSLGGLAAAFLGDTLLPAGRWMVFGGLVALAVVLAFDRAVLLAGRALALPFRRRPVKARPPRKKEPAVAPVVEAEEEEAAPEPEPEEDAVAVERRPPVPIVRSHTPAAKEKPPADFALPPLTLLDDPKPAVKGDQDAALRERAALLEKTCADFGLKVRVVGIHTGPVVTQFEVALDTGLRLGKLVSLADDLAIGLSVPSVRVSALPGRASVGVEVPNLHRSPVRLKELVTAGPIKGKLPIFLGKDAEGKPLVYDLADMPHLLIAGRTGTGKSVCLNAVIVSLLLARKPDECKLLLLDPKQVEFADYAAIAHLMHPVVTDTEKMVAVLSWAVDKMEERYDLLRRARVRNITAFNELAPEEVLRRVQPGPEERERLPPKMPYIVLIVDEVGDLMATKKKEVEGSIIRLAQKSRAAGIHLVLATQRPTVDVITGLIKSNLPARACFQVSNRTDSRVVLDEMGAEKLLGMGDMLFLKPGTSTLVRAQGTYVSDAEIARVAAHLEAEPDFEPELLELGESGGGPSGEGGLIERLRARDPLYEQAIEVVVREGRGSVSLLQRALGIGYGRAARLVDFMAEDGIVGDYNGSQARDVQYTPEQWNTLKGGGEAA